MLYYIIDSLGVVELISVYYRGYVYDAETGLYYLQSRYYDPEIGRFINADAFVSTGQGFVGNNMFAYCANNPILYKDPTGNTAVFSIVNAVLCELQKVAKKALSVAELSVQLIVMGFSNLSPESVISCVDTLEMYEIDTPEEKAHFFAQCAAETNFGMWLTEIGSDSYFAGKAYGKKYRGSGYIQLTWDYNYAAFTEDMGDPEIYNQGAEYVAANYAWQAAGWWWANNNMNNRIANGYTVREVTRRVRGSDGTWETRQKYYDRFIRIFS